PTAYVNHVFNPAGGMAVVATTSSLMCIDDAGAERWSLPTERPRYLVLSPDGTRVAVLDTQRRVTVRSTPGGELLASVSDAILGEYGSLGFDPSGERVLVQMRDNSVRLVDLRDGSSTTVIEPSSDEVIMTAFSPDGQSLAY